MSEKDFPALSDPAYRIEAELGEGSGGVVYKAWHTRLQKYVVLKRIKDESGLLQSSRQRGEADILKNLKHANLPQLYDFLEDPSGVYTVIEFIPGQSFAELLKEGRAFTQQQTVRWAEQLSSALAYLHAQTPTVLHSDIKPGNIMLTTDGDVCLIDFNISLVLAGGDTEMLGLSHGYASPEQYSPQELPRSKQIAPEKQAAGSKPKGGFSDAGTDRAADVETEYTSVGSEVTEFSAGVGTRYQAAGSEVTELVAQSAGSEVTEFSAGIGTSYQAAGSEVTELVHGSPMGAPQPQQQALQRRMSQTQQMSQPQVPPSPQVSPLPSTQRQAMIRMDARSDIYSLGATLYHIVTGEKPAIATEQIKPLSKFNIHLSKAFIYIIERCMERDPSKRFQATASLHEAVANIHKLDSRWKSHQIKATMTAAILAVLFALSCATAFFGWQRMDSEAIEAYNGYVLRIVSENGDSAYESAIALFPENPSAYREQALKLYQAGYYGGCIEYVKSAVAKLSAFGYDAAGIKKIGDIYYILGNAYFTLEDDQNSLTAYDAAIKNNPENFEIYRDFAIALVRCGYIDRAEDMLKGVSGMNMGNDSMNLLRGEIAYAKGSDENAIVLLKEVIKETDSDYIRNRAYLICDRSYRRIPELIDDEIALLQDALRGLPANYLLFIKERLADAYVRDGNYNEALKLLEEFRKSGNIAFATWQNIGVLHQKIGDFASARVVFTEMLAAYPNDYRPPMRLAYLVLEEQGALPNDDRDYTEVALYHEQAFGLFKDNDIEMEMLGKLVAELRRNGWIGSGV